jgi:hypothetical protein
MSRPSQWSLSFWLSHQYPIPPFVLHLLYILSWKCLISNSSRSISFSVATIYKIFVKSYGGRIFLSRSLHPTLFRHETGYNPCGLEFNSKKLRREPCMICYFVVPCPHALGAKETNALWIAETVNAVLRPSADCCLCNLTSDFLWRCELCLAGISERSQASVTLHVTHFGARIKIATEVSIRTESCYSHSERLMFWMTYSTRK